MCKSDPSRDPPSLLARIGVLAYTIFIPFLLCIAATPLLWGLCFGFCKVTVGILTALAM